MNNKEAAVEFMRLLTSGKVDEAYERFVDMKGRHHNAFTPAGFPRLKAGMLENEKAFPNKEWKPLHAVEEGDTVMVHSSIALHAQLRLAAVHVFRFEGGRIAELWDIVQEVPEDSPNADGMF